MRNTWKRILVLMLAVVMILGLTACSKTEPEQGGKETTAANETKAPDSQGAQGDALTPWPGPARPLPCSRLDPSPCLLSR